MDSLWKKLKIYHYFGISALEIDKSGVIRPMARWKFLARLVFSLAVVTAISQSGYILAVYDNPHLSYQEVQEDLSRFHKSTIDNIVIISSILLTCLSSLALVKENYTLSRKSPEYWQSLLAEGSAENPLVNEISSKTQKWVNRIMLTCCVSVMSLFAGMTASTAEKIQLSPLAIVWISAGFTGLNSYTYSASAMSMANFGESIALLCGFCSNLEVQLDEIMDMRHRSVKNKEALERTRSMSATFFVKKSLAFFKGIKETEELFGRIHVVFMASGLISLVLLFFNTMTLFFDPEVFNNWWSVLMFFGYFGVCIIGIRVAAFMPQMTHELSVRIQHLETKLDTIPDEKENDLIICLDDGTECRFKTAKKHILTKLKEFQGFSVMDFFTIRRSVITSILAHFITYSIVLLQFKVSELSSTKYCSLIHNSSAVYIK